MGVNVMANVDPEDVLGEMTTDEIIKYLRVDRDIGGELEKGEISPHDDLVQAFFHGDFDLKSLLKAIGKDPVNKILKELNQEKFIEIV